MSLVVLGCLIAYGTLFATNVASPWFWLPIAAAGLLVGVPLFIAVTKDALHRQMGADVVAAGTERALDQIAPFTDKIVIIEPMPETQTSMLDCLSTGADPESCDQQIDIKTGTQTFEKITRALAKENPHVLSVSLHELICPQGTCPAEVNGIPTHRDNQHLTWDYAEAIMPDLDDLLTKAGAPLS